jgi:hypothetical protein
MNVIAPYHLPSPAFYLFFSFVDAFKMYGQITAGDLTIFDQAHTGNLYYIQQEVQKNPSVITKEDSVRKHHLSPF